MDYYSTLGLQRNASDADIKKAYRSMAMKHHPDRGGDEKKFKEISQAYEFLSDPQKKQMIDMGVDPNQQHQGGGQHFYQNNPFEFHFGGGVPPGMEDIFGHFGFGQRQPRKNKSVNINVELSLEEVIAGKDLNAEMNMPSGRNKLINISIPPGVDHGQQIRYGGMGDDTFRELPAGDLIVTIYVKRHPKFVREGDNLIYEHTISAWDAILGSSINLNTLEGKNINIGVPTGTQPGTVLSCKGEGIPNIRSRIKGSLLIKVNVEIPRNLTPTQLNAVRDIKNGI
jgi:DnaJ-class molecular chaperone